MERDGAMAMVARLQDDVLRGRDMERPEHVVLLDNEYVDMRLEELMEEFVTGEFVLYANERLNSLLQEYIHESIPQIDAIRCCSDPTRTGAATSYLVGLGIDFVVITQASPEWPGFEYMENANVAVSIYYNNDDDDYTTYSPGTNINQACILALIQMMREHAYVMYNQEPLPLLMH